MSTTDAPDTETAAWQPRLSVWDAASLMIGIVVGTSLFVLPPMIFSSVAAPANGIALWCLGGALSLIGALVFAEMAVAIPKGGAYAFLTAAFGRGVGLVYGVAAISIIATSTIGAMAFAFARYAAPFGIAPSAQPAVAMAAITMLAIFNSLSLQSGRVVQNALTTAKLMGLLGIVIAAALAPPAGMSATPAVAASEPNLATALVLVLYAYGGWSDAAAVAAEVRSRQRNIPRALVGGLSGVTAIYALVNLAYLRVLGWDGLRMSEAPARDALEQAGGAWAGAVVSLIVMVSALGAVHGMLFSGARSAAALGEDQRMFASLAVWSVRGVPSRAVWLLAAIANAQILLVGTETGRAAVDRTLSAIRLGPAPWDRFHGGFDTLVAASAPTFWTLMLASGLAFFRLRALRLTPTGFRCPLAPWLPLAYCGTCLFMLVNSIEYAGLLGLFGSLPCGVAALLAPLTRVRGSGAE